MLKCYSASKTRKEKSKVLFNKLRKFVKERKKFFFHVTRNSTISSSYLLIFFCICFSWHRCYVKRGWNTNFSIPSSCSLKKIFSSFFFCLASFIWCVMWDFARFKFEWDFFFRCGKKKFYVRFNNCWMKKRGVKKKICFYLNLFYDGKDSSLCAIVGK